MTQDTLAIALDERRALSRRLTRLLALSVLPVVAALLASAVILLLAGGDPLAYYGLVIERGLLRATGFQATLVYSIPMLIVASALIISFRAGLWNLGVDGQVLLGTMVAGVTAPLLAQHMPIELALVIALCLSAVAGALWAIPMAVLKAYQGINEIISGLMMSFLAGSFCAAMIKLVFRDETSYNPQTMTLAADDRLSQLFGSSVNFGLVIAVVLVIGTHLMITRTSFGLRLRLLGLNPSAAQHVGLPVPLLTLLTLCLSGALAGLAGGVDLVGVLGNMKADWNPQYGFAVVPLVFLARMNGYASIAFIFVFSVLEVGSASAATRLGIPMDFTLIVVGLLLAFLALAEYAEQHADRRKD
ncbi:putative B6 ABC transporter permease subunit 2 [Devosia sp. A369]